MTVNELLKILNQVTDKNKEVYIGVITEDGFSPRGVAGVYDGYPDDVVIADEEVFEAECDSIQEKLE